VDLHHTYPVVQCVAHVPCDLIPDSTPNQNRLRRLNGTIFGGRLPPDLQVSWNARLKTTAGLTHYKRQLVDGSFR